MILKFYGRVGNGVFVFSIPAFLTGTDEDRLLLRRYLGAILRLDIFYCLYEQCFIIVSAQF